MLAIRMSPRKTGIGAFALVVALALVAGALAIWPPNQHSFVYRADHDNDVVVTEFGTCDTADIRPDLGNGASSSDPGFFNVLVNAGSSDARPANYTEVAYLDASGKILGGIYSTDNYTSRGHSAYLIPDQVTRLAHTRCVTVTPDDDRILPLWAVYPVHVRSAALDLQAAPKFQDLLDSDSISFLSGAASAETLTVTGWPALTQTATGVWTGIPWLLVPTH